MGAKERCGVGGLALVRDGASLCGDWGMDGPDTLEMGEVAENG